MQINRNSHMYVVKKNQIQVVNKNRNDAKRIAYLEKTVLELLLKNDNSVLHEFAKKMGVTPRQILEHNKSDRMCDIRHLYCHLRCKVHGISFSEVGLEINRSHTAVSKGVKRIKDMFDIKNEPIEELWDKVKHISEVGEYIIMYDPR